ncbi:MAG: Stp1/IreP family PP2C-type Ser/Thr phosphatase [Chloroflexota bacterium]
MSSFGKIRSAYLTDRGRVRDHNEDYVIGHEPENQEQASQDGWVYVVADGVGGADAGEVASQFASKKTIDHFLGTGDEDDMGDRLKKAIEQAHYDLCSLIEERQDDRRMGTTIVATAIRDNHVSIANVGDSRGYHISNGHIIQITKDHSLIAKLLEEGIVTAEEADALNIGNIILQSIGSEQAPVVDIFKLSLQENDSLLLCSDGLTNHVSDDEIAEIVTNETPDEATQMLIDLANQRGGHDNITVLVLTYGASAPSVNGSAD